MYRDTDMKISYFKAYSKHVAMLRHSIWDYTHDSCLCVFDTKMYLVNPVYYINILKSSTNESTGRH